MEEFIRNAKDFYPTVSQKRREAWAKLSKLLNDRSYNSIQVANELGVSAMAAMMILKNDAAYVSITEEMLQGMERLTGFSAKFWREQFN